MTFLFAAGVAAVILPIALGAAVLQRVFIESHDPAFAEAGLGKAERSQQVYYLL